MTVCRKILAEDAESLASFGELATALAPWEDYCIVYVNNAAFDAQDMADALLTAKHKASPSSSPLVLGLRHSSIMSGLSVSFDNVSLAMGGLGLEFFQLAEGTNILSDLIAAKSGALAMCPEIIDEPLWGKTLTEITAKITSLVDQIKYGVGNPELQIDCVAVWQGNELVGSRLVGLEDAAARGGLGLDLRTLATWIDKDVVSVRQWLFQSKLLAVAAGLHHCDGVCVEGHLAAAEGLENVIGFVSQEPVVWEGTWRDNLDLEDRTCP
ncbi:hypothetical protein AK812_SmicGene38505 [Symbiodinium microadriaticum]|uniref:Uncharacterized protein n=1 Tax=Symbiodinium microadriaticum TaxID=2951 RepID=A0A1Q9CDM0_SYMMI|nr:hypothetical protein AK812_SmicGene38505 [Symbiodinium microadriaticum]